MTKLTTKARKAIPKKEFGEPSKRAYPMEDKARASEMHHKGKLSKSAMEKIDAKADKKLGKKK